LAAAGGRPRIVAGLMRLKQPPQDRKKLSQDRDLL
jgi:hypothetical protein